MAAYVCVRPCVHIFTCFFIKKKKKLKINLIKYIYIKKKYKNTHKTFSPPRDVSEHFTFRQSHLCVSSCAVSPGQDRGTSSAPAPRWIRPGLVLGAGQAAREQFGYHSSCGSRTCTLVHPWGAHRPCFPLAGSIPPSTCTVCLTSTLLLPDCAVFRLKASPWTRGTACPAAAEGAGAANGL